MLKDFVGYDWAYTSNVDIIKIHPLGIHVRYYVPIGYKGFNW